MEKVLAAFDLTSIESLRLVALEESFLNTILSTLKTYKGLRRMDVAYGSVASAEAVVAEVVGATSTPLLVAVRLGVCMYCFCVGTVWNRARPLNHNNIITMTLPHDDVSRDPIDDAYYEILSRTPECLRVLLSTHL